MFRAVYLVHSDKDLFLAFAQDLSHLFIARHYPLPAVYHEDHPVGLVHGLFHLSPYFL